MDWEKLIFIVTQNANYYILLPIRNIIRSLRVTDVYFLHRKDAGAFDLFLCAVADGIFTLWDKLVTLYERISIRLPLQCIKRYVVAVCLMHHIRPCSFRCRYVFMFRFESFYSFESGWKCGSESPEFSSFYLIQGIRRNVRDLPARQNLLLLWWTNLTILFNNNLITISFNINCV